MQIVQLLEQMGTIAFWEGLLQSFQALGPVVPIALAAIESLVPVLPLVGIVTVNVAAHGPLFGFLYSWIGTCVGCYLMFFLFRRLFSQWAIRMSTPPGKGPVLGEPHETGRAVCAFDYALYPVGLCELRVRRVGV